MADNIIYAREADWVSLLDKIREKSGKQEWMTLPQAIQTMSDIPDKIYKDIVTGNLGNVETISLPDSILQSGTFYNMKNLKTVNLPNYTGGLVNSEWASYVFYNCESLNMEKGLEKIKYIGPYTFALESPYVYKALEQKLEFNNLSSVYKCGFYNNVKIKEFKSLSVEAIWQEAFNYCKNMVGFYAPNLKNIYDKAFANTGLLSFCIEGKSISIGDYVFEKSNIKTLKFKSPEIKMTIHSLKNSPLTSFWIGPGVKFIETGSTPDNPDNKKLLFYNTTSINSLKDIYVSNYGTGYLENVTTPTIHYNVSESDYNNIIKQIGGIVY
jgi:hypothetical protein